MLLLVLAGLLWVAVHVGIAGTGLRGVLVARIGENGFRIAFSLGSVVAIALLVSAWKASPAVALWTTPGALKWLALVLMLPAFILFAGSLATKNPTAMGGEGAAPRGMIRITRHPMLWSFAIWAILHALVNGTQSGLVFFGAFAVTALAGMPSIDAKLAARNPAGFAALRAQTSILPGGAIAAGRNHVVPTELVLPVAIGTVAWIAMLLAHRWVIGVSPFPA
ncbi:NnrU family protein [Plastoroseomonas arctica]|uniref:NnrU family protein n=1 Tax=Plastoroseomonas arctica TaxID=1509237 RepID=A0AAF1JVX1_9PROT|nr:NnrU family protein [Plastoroseomonas arctica]MBR0654880.1 NnrU family protein [Plastoroseomonas arctica]